MACLAPIGDELARVGVRLLAVLAVAGVAACSEPPQRPEPSVEPVSVGATAEGLTLDGKPWWPSGFDAPQLATNFAINFGCGAEVELDSYFGSLPKNALTRFNLFQAFAVDKTTGELNFTAVDAVFQAAERHRQAVLPVLSAQDGGCSDERFKQRQWYVEGWKQFRPVRGRAVMSYRDWVRTAVSRWHDSPVLAGWELVGEPEASECAGRDCTLRARTCPADAAQVLRRFFDEAGAIVRKLDPGRLIFSGFTGGGQCGTAGADYAFVAASPQVDVLDYHDYSKDPAVLPGDGHDGLAVRFQQARDLGKPLLLAEVGEEAGSCRSPQARRDDMAVKLTTVREAGAAGALFWAFVPDPRPDECTLDIGPRDPLWTLVAERITVGP
ncbi:beta-mannosidase [Nocardia sp. NPDC127526]|uniref:beta-mannosidase n=1 Tax=Nocardia sp. NPDC127526 TaxID=3345393 RepID=UPI003637E6AB